MSHEDCLLMTAAISSIATTVHVLTWQLLVCTILQAIFRSCFKGKT